MTAAAVQVEPRLKSRRYGAHGHGYLIDGEKVPGVTTILNALPKQLKQWGADCAANLAVEKWDELAQLPLTKRLDRIRYAHKDVVGEAALRGQEIHKYGEALAHGREIEVPDEYRGPAQAYARFLDRWEIEVESTEYAIANFTHRYGGRGDLIATVGKRGGARCAIDLKSGKNIYESVVLQLAGYDGAEVWQPDGPESEQPYVPVDLMYVAHVLPDDVRMLPVRGAGGAARPGVPEFRQFLYTLQTHLWLEAHGYKGDEPLIEAAERP